MRFLPCITVAGQEAGLPWPDADPRAVPAVAFGLEDVDPFSCSLPDLRRQLDAAAAAGEPAREATGYLGGVLATRMVAEREAGERERQAAWRAKL